MLATPVLDRDVIEAAPVEMRAELALDLLGVLIRDEAHVDLHARLGRSDRLRVVAGPARPDPRDVAGRVEQLRDLRVGAAATADEALRAVDRLQLLLLERDRPEVPEPRPARLA